MYHTFRSCTCALRRSSQLSNYYSYIRHKVHRKPILTISTRIMEINCLTCDWTSDACAIAHKMNMLRIIVALLFNYSDWRMLAINRRRAQNSKTKRTILIKKKNNCRWLFNCFTRFNMANKQILLFTVCTIQYSYMRMCVCVCYAHWEHFERCLALDRSTRTDRILERFFRVIQTCRVFDGDWLASGCC